ncbi:RNA-directed DNA polymerase, eukaryota, reverse transcriptase zinc-binding domain protein [Tanacetum coccineum]
MCIWDEKVYRGYSWSWKQLLDLRDEFKFFVRVKIRSEKQCFIWFDRWSGQGPLGRVINHRALADANLNVKTKVVDMIEDNNWKWPLEWDGVYDDGFDIPVPKHIDDLDDKTVWVNKKGKEKIFSVKEIWKAIKDESPKVIWSEHVWYSQCIPKHSFILWVAIRGRLKTRDRLSKWFEVPDRRCLLCNIHDESHGQLFFSCPYSKRLWEILKPLAMMENISNEWASVISGIVLKPTSNFIWSVIQRLVWGAVVYFLWQERNVRRVNQIYRSEECLFKCIVETIRLKLMGLALKKSAEVLKAARMWNLAVNRDGFDMDMGDASD